MMVINDNIVSCFFVEKRYRIYRHIALFTLMAIITLSFVWYVPVTNVPECYRIYGWFINLIVLAGIIYHNLYIAVPRMLLENKVMRYIFVLIVYVMAASVCIIFVQYSVLKVDWIDDNDTLRIFINLFSAIFTLGFLFMGTTSILLVKYRVISDIEKTELESSILESELKLLENQVNPHFLFNMLNNANMLLKKDRKQAAEVLFKLEDLLRYQIHNNIKEKVSLASEINFLNDYLNLEKIRRDKFDYSISETGSCRQERVSPLLFIIFVENAVKHNVDNENLSYVKVSFGCSEGKLEFICENSKPEQEIRPKKVGGLGLKNIRRRLELLYPENHQLEIKDERLKYTVKLTLTLLK